jgi:hypothetical protein
MGGVGAGERGVWAFFLEVSLFELNVCLLTG